MLLNVTKQNKKSNIIKITSKNKSNLTFKTNCIVIFVFIYVFIYIFNF